MGMNLNFSVEDINIEITDAGGEVEETVEDQIADQEAQEEVEEASEEVETAAKFGLQIVAIHENLSFIKKHVEMFGVTKQMLHLVNANGQLGSAIGLSLPHYESDDEAEDIVMDDVPEAEVVVEALGDVLKKAKDNIKKFFKILWDKIKAFFKAIVTRIQGFEKTLTNLKAKFSKSNIDNGKYGNLPEVSAYTASQFAQKWAAIDAAIDAIKAFKISYTGTMSDDAKIRTGLNTLGKTFKDNKVSQEGTGIKPEKIALTTTWNKSELIKNIDACLAFSKSYKTEQSNIEKVVKAGETEAMKQIDAENSDDDSKNMIKEKIPAIVSAIISAYNSLINEKISMTRQLIAIGKRVPMIGEKKAEPEKK